MIATVSRAERREAAQREARRMQEAMAAWRKAHPEASDGEVEGELRRRRRELMACLVRLLGG